MDEEAKSRRELLLTVYDAAINEYRFNVQLSWDRTKFFLLLNSGLIAAGVGLLKVAENSVITSAFLVLFFLFAILITVSGLETVAIGKAYYREAVFTKTLVERELGLLDPIPGLQDPRANLSIAVTRGQRNVEAIFSSESKASELRETLISRGTITFYSQIVFWMMILIEALGAIMAIVNATMKASG